MGDNRGSIAFATTYRPPVPLDIFSLPLSGRRLAPADEVHMTDGESYNYNGRAIPPAALKTMLPKLDPHANPADVTGIIFVSERDNGLETLHIALRYKNAPQKNRVVSFSGLYDQAYKDVRLEDSPSFIGGDYLVYVSTMKDPKIRRHPWTAVYKTDLKTGKTEILTGQKKVVGSGKPVAHLSPSISPSGKYIAVAQFGPTGWGGEIEDLNTDICLINVSRPQGVETLPIKGGWPTWGSDDVIFYHRKVDKHWGVFRYQIGKRNSEIRVTPEGIDAFTPVAIDADRVAVATIRKETAIDKEFQRKESEQYRHIEIFTYSPPSRPSKQSERITEKTKPFADHYNPFLIDVPEKRIGYHRCRTEHLAEMKAAIVTKADHDMKNHTFDKVKSPHPTIELLRVAGVFPAFSNDGSQLAFVDNEFKGLWVANKHGLNKVYQTDGELKNNIFSPVWHPNNNGVFVCKGPSFSAKDELNICYIDNVSHGKRTNNFKRLTSGSNNAFPSSNPEGTKLVFRSTRDHDKSKGIIYKNLYIMDLEGGEYFGREPERLTDGEYIDTHCQWSPNKSTQWIVFASTRSRPDENKVKVVVDPLDLGYFGVYLIKADDRTVKVRVINSGDDLSGHVNHPYFSPDGMSIVFTADLAAVSADPISLPIFIHSVRPYGDIFIVDIDLTNIKNNENKKDFRRLTHSRYENSTASWTKFATHNPLATWSKEFPMKTYTEIKNLCPYIKGKSEAEIWSMTGHLGVKKSRRCC